MKVGGVNELVGSWAQWNDSTKAQAQIWAFWIRAWYKLFTSSWVGSLIFFNNEI